MRSNKCVGCWKKIGVDPSTVPAYSPLTEAQRAAREKRRSPEQILLREAKKKIKGKKMKRKVKLLLQENVRLQRAISERPRLYKPHPFYDSREWKTLRYEVIRRNGRVCAACRRTDGVMHVDHIKPRSKFPELQLSIENLQVLCAECNTGKGSSDQTDWRGK